jgi:hypothetical protein
MTTIFYGILEKMYLCYLWKVIVTPPSTAFSAGDSLHHLLHIDMHSFSVVPSEKYIYSTVYAYLAGGNITTFFMQ